MIDSKLCMIVGVILLLSSPLFILFLWGIGLSEEVTRESLNRHITIGLTFVALSCVVKTPPNA